MAEYLNPQSQAQSDAETREANTAGAPPAAHHHTGKKPTSPAAGNLGSIPDKKAIQGVWEVIDHQGTASGLVVTEKQAERGFGTLGGGGIFDPYRLPPARGKGARLIITDKSLKVGGTTYTSKEALQRFADRLSGPPLDADTTPTATLTRQKQIDQAAKQVEAILGGNGKKGKR